MPPHGRHPISTSTYPGRHLKLGDHGDAVKKAKHALEARRNKHDETQPRLPGDDEFGQRMELRVEQFQGHHHLGVDGIIGPETWAALFHEPRWQPDERVLPHVVYRLNVVCQSSRISPIDGIVLHDTEGANIKGIRDLQGLGGYFNVLAHEASSHTATDAEGLSARFVQDHRKAWHVAAYNSRKLGIEQIGFASQKTWPTAQLEETARWCAYWCRLHGIPIVHSIERGICMHSELGAAGGGHTDPGAAYPLARVLDLTRHFYDLRKQED